MKTDHTDEKAPLVEKNSKEKISTPSNPNYSTVQTQSPKNPRPEPSSEMEREEKRIVKKKSKFGKPSKLDELRKDFNLFFKSYRCSGQVKVDTFFKRN